MISWAFGRMWGWKQNSHVHWRQAFELIKSRFMRLNSIKWGHDQYSCLNILPGLAILWVLQLKRLGWLGAYPAPRFVEHRFSNWNYVDKIFRWQGIHIESSSMIAKYFPFSTASKAQNCATFKHTTVCFPCLKLTTILQALAFIV